MGDVRSNAPCLFGNLLNAVPFSYVFANSETKLTYQCTWYFILMMFLYCKIVSSSEKKNIYTKNYHDYLSNHIYYL